MTVSRSIPLRCWWARRNGPRPAPGTTGPAGAFRLPASADLIAKTFLALEDGFVLDVLIGAMSPDEEERMLLLYAQSMIGIPATL